MSKFVEVNCKVCIALTILNIFISAVTEQITGVLGWGAALASCVYIAKSEINK